MAAFAISASAVFCNDGDGDHGCHLYMGLTVVSGQAGQVV